MRDLKREAPGLVKRASRGERIVITRYGRPMAALVPVESVSGGTGPGAPSEWDAERRAFESMRPRLERRFRGRYVAVHAGRVVGVHDDPDSLYERTWRKLGGKVFFIGRVGTPGIVDMPGVEIE